MRVIIEKTEDGIINVTRETNCEAIDIAQLMLKGEERPGEMWNEEVDSRATKH